MTEQQTQMSQINQDEIRTFANKLGSFRDSLNPVEQRLFTEMMRRCENSVADTRGFDEGDPRGDTVHDFPWLDTLALQLGSIDPKIGPSGTTQVGNRLEGLHH